MTLRHAALALAILSITSLAADAAEPRAPQGANGCTNPAALGVSRVVEIDTAAGPQLGFQQYKFHEFLEPGEVVLTFDDGPLRPYTTAVLKALDAHCTKATFFSVGKMAIADPEMIRDMERRGHTIGTHTWSHRNLRAMGPGLAKGEVELGVSAVSKAAGHPIAPFFRFPYLADSRAMIAHAKSRGIGMFSIEIDAVDYRTSDPATVHNRVLASLKDQGKGILLFHDIQPSTAGALKGLLDAMHAKGYRVVHMKPKGPVHTLPEYDAIAEQQFNAKRMAGASSPLANRAIVWPNAQASAAPDDALAQGAAAAPRRTASAATALRRPQPPLAAPAAGQAPPQAYSQGPSPMPKFPAASAIAGPAAASQPPAVAAAPPMPEAAPPRPVRQPWRNPDEDNWRSRIFQN